MLDAVQWKTMKIICSLQMRVRTIDERNIIFFLWIADFFYRSYNLHKKFSFCSPKFSIQDYDVNTWGYKRVGKNVKI